MFRYKKHLKPRENIVSLVVGKFTSSQINCKVSSGFARRGMGKYWLLGCLEIVDALSIAMSSLAYNAK